MYVFVFLAALSLPFTVMTSHLAAAQSTGQQRPSDKNSNKTADRWQLLGRDGHCSSFKTLKQTFPDIPPINTPQALQQYLKTHEGIPLLYPINDPEFPDLKGYSLFDPAHHLSFIILPAAHCKGQFIAHEQTHSVQDSH